MTDRKQIPCLEGWITMPPEEPRIIGSKCMSCGHYFFPKVTSCRNPYCQKTKLVEDVLISRKGKLYSYTVNYYPPPPPYHAPEPFVPFGIACVEMPEGIKVTGQIPMGVDLDSLKIGMMMETVREVLYIDGQGNEVLSWMFKPGP